MRRLLFLAIPLATVVWGCQSPNRVVFSRSQEEPRPVATFAQPIEAFEQFPAIAPVVFPPASRPLIANAAPWPLELDRAITIGLEHSEVVRTLSGGEVFASGITSYDTAVTHEAVRAALGTFDTSFAASFFWNDINEPPGALLYPGLLNPGRYDEGGFTFNFTKQWETGTQTRIGYNPPTGYLYYPDGAMGGFNPTHTANIEVSVSQPLLRGAGTEVNRAPTVIAQAKTGQSAWDFKRAMMAYVRSIEQAYWELSAAQIAMRGIEEQLPLMDEVVRLERANVAAKRTVAADAAKTEAQLHAFRQRRLQAQAVVVERELRLRHLIGLDPEPGGRIVAATPPPRAPIAIDTRAMLSTAVDHRPDLLRQRLGIRIREMELLLAKNSLRPKLDLQALYRMNGVAQDLGDALSMMASNQYQDWQFGATFSVPLEHNTGKANVRAAELQIEREHALLAENIESVTFEITNIAEQVRLLQQQCAEAEQRVGNCQEWLRGARIRYQIPMPGGEGGNWLLVALDDYLLAMRSTADATMEVGELLAHYNTELALLDEAAGVLLENENISLSDDPTQKMRVSRSLPQPQR